MTESENKQLALRPQIATEPAGTESEKFQNETLRPILKLNNDLLIRVFQHYISKHKNTFRKLAGIAKEEYVTKSLKQDHNFRHFLRGTVVAHFTNSEWELFIKHEDEFNKRIMNLIAQRLISQLEKI